MTTTGNKYTNDGSFDFKYEETVNKDSVAFYSHSNLVRFDYHFAKIPPKNAFRIHSYSNLKTILG